MDQVKTNRLLRSSKTICDKNESKKFEYEDFYEEI